MIEEIGGKKEREKKFGEFTGLEAAEAWNAHPDTSAVDLCADNRQHGGKQQYQTHHHRHVGKAPENAVISQEDDDQRRKHQSNVQPYDLALGDIPSLALIDAGDHRDAGGGEQQYARHDGLAGIRLEAGGQPTEHEEQCGRAHNMMAYCTGNAPVVRWNIWMNASALIATASRSSAIWRKRVAIIAILPWWRRRLPQCRTRTCWYCRKWTSWMSLTSCWMWTSWPARSPAAS